MSKASEKPKHWTVLELIKWGAEYFASKEVESGRLTMELLLCHVLQTTRIALYSDYDRPLNNQELSVLRSFVKRIALYEPLQYVLGEAYFYSLRFKVTPDVLVPRPETEILVEAAIAIPGKNQRCLDIGTGSGAIAISIAAHRPTTTWLCLDKSSRALEVAVENAQLNKVSNQCTFTVIDILTTVPTGRFDIICMNPPYIPASEVTQLAPTVRDYEPHSALTDDKDGLTFFKRLVTLLPDILTDDGTALFEIGWGMAEQIEELFRSQWQVHFLNDLSGIPRVVVIKK